ncbi:PLDc N-terminal domain-containing protein [Microbacteriaceae bacterium VKM Ac-2855]|nr:PLDc N-terminal domain-containing protein [Microbacteriaceae bacterium VKM Ac-2855]
MDNSWWLFLLFLAGLILLIAALSDIKRARIDATPEAIWVVAVLVSPVVGSIAWFAIGAKRRIR